MARMRARRRSVLAVVVLASLYLGGCVTSTTTQSFRVVKDANVESGYIATDADFSQYDRLLGKDMGIFFPSGAPLSEADIQRIRQIFRSAFFAELEHYTIVTEAGSGVMTVEASLIDMRSGTYEEVPGMRSELRELGQPGELVFLMELRDSASDRVLGRAADSAYTPSLATGGGRETDWAGVESAAQNWATLFRNFLDQNLQQNGVIEK
ncbi:MAG: hypothetical protein ACI88G_002292 [Woeseiaceae bacterium]|jgi:hypothetical protein